MYLNILSIILNFYLYILALVNLYYYGGRIYFTIQGGSTYLSHDGAAVTRVSNQVTVYKRK